MLFSEHFSIAGVVEYNGKGSFGSANEIRLKRFFVFYIFFIPVLFFDCGHMEKSNH